MQKLINDLIIKLTHIQSEKIGNLERYEDSNGKLMFNKDLAYEAYKAKKAAGFERDAEVKGHAYVGKKIMYNGKIRTIEKVVKHYYMGYYLLALAVDENGSHAAIMFSNLNHFGSLNFKELEFVEDKK